MIDPRHRAVTPDPASFSTPLERLAGAVVVKAIEDALKGDAYATLWLLDADSGFELWAELLNLRPEIARQRVASYLRDNHGKARRVSRRAAH